VRTDPATLYCDRYRLEQSEGGYQRVPIVTCSIFPFILEPLLINYRHSSHRANSSKSNLDPSTFDRAEARDEAFSNTR
jgi:hypothetical protein